MPPSFMDHALKDLLGLEASNLSVERGKAKPPTAKMMVSFMTRAFRRCTQDARLVVLALDDLHNADEFSWKVIRELFENTNNLLIIGTTYPEDEGNMQVEPDFWNNLNTTYKDANSFFKLELGPLNREEITSMIMKTLALRRKEVKDDVLEGVSIQSGGLPHFVNEILEHVKQQMVLDPDFEIGDVSQRMTRARKCDLDSQSTHSFSPRCR